jgi:hypothetical protein
MKYRMHTPLVLLASLFLTACGPDEGASTSATPASNAQQSTPINDLASHDVAVMSSEQQQVTPIVHYPPDTSSSQ